MDGLIFGLVDNGVLIFFAYIGLDLEGKISDMIGTRVRVGLGAILGGAFGNICLLYTSPSPRDGLLSRMPSSA